MRDAKRKINGFILEAESLYYDLLIYSPLNSESMFKFNCCLVLFSLISLSIIAQDQCDAPLKALHKTLSVSSETVLVEKLKYIYSATSQSEATSRNNSSLKIDIPDYGSGLWNSNKEKINNVYSSTDIDVDYLYSLDEKKEIYYSFYDSKDYAAGIDAWLACVDQGIRRLKIQENAQDQVVVTVNMASDDLPRNKKVKVRDITSSANLKLIKSSIPGNKKIKYSGEQTLTFQRLNDKAGFVRMDLEHGSIRPALIPRVGKTETLKEKTVYINLSANMSANWLKTEYDTTPFKFPNQDRSHYILNVTNRKTNIPANNNEKILSCWYEPGAGGIGKFEFQKSRIEDGKHVIDFYFISGAKKMTGKIGILYSYTMQE